MNDVSKTLEERGARYGASIDHATICQGLIEVLHEAPNWWRLDPDMKQAMHVICDKMARCLNGDPYYADNWHDMQGYARLVEVRVLKLAEDKAAKEERKGQLFEDNEEDEMIIAAGGNRPFAAEDSPSCGENRSRWSTEANDKVNDSNYDVGNYRG